MRLPELEPGIPVPGSSWLPKRVKLQRGTLLPKSVELVLERLWLSECVELELGGMLVELEGGIPVPELFGLPTYLKSELGTPFPGLIRVAEPETEIPVAELPWLSERPEAKPGTPFSCPLI